MTTGRQVFQTAMHLIDEQDPRTGATDRSENREYEVRAPALLDLLAQEVCSLDDDWSSERDRGLSPEPTRDLDGRLDLSDRICRGLLPYGLAGMLILEENRDCATYFLNKYAALKDEFRRQAGARRTRICDVYGGIEMGRFGSW